MPRWPGVHPSQHDTDAFSASAERDLLVVKYGTDGKKLWEVRYDSPFETTNPLYPMHDEGKAISLDKQGNVIVAGISSGEGAGQRVTYRADGSILNTLSQSSAQLTRGRYTGGNYYFAGFKGSPPTLTLWKYQAN